MRSGVGLDRGWTRCGGRISTSWDAPRVDVGLQPDDVDLDHGVAEVDRRAGARRGERRVGAVVLGRGAAAEDVLDDRRGARRVRGHEVAVLVEVGLAVAPVACVLVKSLSALVTRARRARSGSWCGPGSGTSFGISVAGSDGRRRAISASFPAAAPSAAATGSAR
jgi:hypothetical protein